MDEEKLEDLATETTDHDEKQIVVFRLGSEEFGANISEVWKIIRMEQITKIPNTEDYIRGVINLRGGIVVVIDLAMKLGFPVKEPDKNTRIIVIEINGNTVGMIVDCATEMMTLTADKIEPAPAMITQRINADYIEGVGIIGDRLLILLDLAKVLEAKDLRNVQKINDSKQPGKSDSHEHAGKDNNADAAHSDDADKHEHKKAHHK